MCIPVQTSLGRNFESPDDMSVIVLLAEGAKFNA